jgi:cellulose synthase/poly-beta-1,6-N-acetylglucosamine synthase-like glycosyltransferase
MVIWMQVVQFLCLFIGTVFVGALWWGLRRRKSAMISAQPPVSVLVAARDEKDNLPRLLACLEKQDYHPAEKCEFIIIDDASSDGSAEIADCWARRDQRFRVIRLEDAAVRRLGPKKRALAAGIRSSRGEILITTDADSLVPPRWLSEMISHFSAETGAVCGRVRYDRAEGFFGRLASFECTAQTLLNAGVIGIGGALSCAGANFAYRRCAFEDAGGFESGGNAFSGDDDLLLQRIRSRGWKIRFCAHPDAVVRTAAPKDFNSYFQRKRRHLSVGRKYAAHWIALAAAVYIGCASTLALGILRLVGYETGNLFLGWWGVFGSAVWWVYRSGARRIGEKPAWPALWIAVFLFPIYFVLLQPLTLLAPPAWKGRKFDKNRIDSREERVAAIP